eukprot:g6088.t1
MKTTSIVAMALMATAVSAGNLRKGDVLDFTQDAKGDVLYHVTGNCKAMKLKYRIHDELQSALDYEDSPGLTGLRGMLIGAECDKFNRENKKAFADAWFKENPVCKMKPATHKECTGNPLQGFKEDLHKLSTAEKCKTPEFRSRCHDRINKICVDLNEFVSVYRCDAKAIFDATPRCDYDDAWFDNLGR